MEFEILSSHFLLALLSIIILDLVLAGDNAVVIAMAAHKLPEAIRNRAIYWGTFGAIVIRIVMTAVAAYLLSIPLLQAIGGLILLPIAFKLLKPHASHKEIKGETGFMAAIRTIIVADAAMGIDNVLAVAGAAHGSLVLVVIGLLISIPIVVAGSQIIGNLMERFPILIVVGAAILAYTSATMILHDKYLALTTHFGHWIYYLVIILFVGSVVAYGLKHKK